MGELLLLGIKDKQTCALTLVPVGSIRSPFLRMELALRRCIALVKDPNRRRHLIADYLLEFINGLHTGEKILDEALELKKIQEHDEIRPPSSPPYPSETWNTMKISFQLKQVREHIAEGLVDEGILRTEKRTFLLFDMATHPVADVRTKEFVIPAPSPSSSSPPPPCPPRLRRHAAPRHRGGASGVRGTYTECAG
ncbi:Golgi phosphoprotein 3-domain-containing protein [Lyophyllum atratum]|nr:Golgi phosphoprotein 3-domain-containing protein [Lyophyllum atratum]